MNAHTDTLLSGISVKQGLQRIVQAERGNRAWAAL